MGAVQAHGAEPFYVAEKKRPTDCPRNFTWGSSMLVHWKLPFPLLILRHTQPPTLPLSFSLSLVTIIVLNYNIQQFSRIIFQLVFYEYFMNIDQINVNKQASYGRYFKIPKYMLLLIHIIYLNNDSTFHFITNNSENKTINVSR